MITSNAITPEDMRHDTRPAVSIIMPAYNVAAYITDALDSVFAQNFTDYEIIVVNDGAPDTDELERVLEPYRSRIVYIKQENMGVSGARNTAVKAARSPLIAQLDPDDLWEPDYLSSQVAAMNDDPTIDVIYPNAMIFGDSPEAGHEFMEICPSEGEVTFEQLVTQRCNVLYSITARRDVIVRAGMFDESLRGSEDFDLWLRIIKAGGRIAYHRRALLHYRRRSASLTCDVVRMLRYTLQSLEKAERTLNLTTEERGILKREHNRFQATLRFNEGKQAFLSGDVKQAINGLSEANNFFRSRKTALALFFLRLTPRTLLRAYNVRDRFIFKASTKS
ncbi:MAG: glycosyltransferase family 2 protein [Acidobacteria bacterium]|nr:glycosyltransferase family 2 protein [Acidobacteriota bacterium]MBA3804613.1 glycosyltransferase family 2 protein [Acidobacteriota bacterium]